jgi:hypothetical protein
MFIAYQVSIELIHNLRDLVPPSSGTIATSGSDPARRISVRWLKRANADRRQSAQAPRSRTAVRQK